MARGSIPQFMPDFSAYPDLVVIMLGMRVRTLYGVKTLLGLKKPIELAAAGRPDGLLHAENNIAFGLMPMHIGMRWYWRDLDCLQRWTRSEPHRTWWRDFMADTGGTGIWHETYHMRGGMEAIYGDVSAPVGFSAFMPMNAARGSLVSRHKAWESRDLSHLPEQNPL